MEPEEEYDYVHSDKLANGVPMPKPFTKLSTAGYDTSSSMTLASFLAQHTSTLPSTMTACTSYSGGGVTLCQGQQYTVLSIKEQKCVSLKDQEQNPYTLPLHSPILFGIVHHTPATPLSQALLGIEYGTADDLMRQHMTPGAVCSLGGYRSRFPDGCLEEGEVLVIQELKSKGALRKGPAFQAYSITQRCTKSIGRHCDSGFTTHPERVKITLADIVTHMPHPFPAMAVAYIQPEHVGLPRQLTSKVFVLEKVVVKSVMVVKAEGEEPFELLVDTPVRVTKSDAVPKRGDGSGTGPGDKLEIASRSGSDSINRAASTGSDASSGLAGGSGSGVVGGSGRAVERMNSAPPCLPPQEDIYDNDEQSWMTYLKQRAPPTSRGAGVGGVKSDPVTVPSPQKPLIPPPRVADYNVPSVEISNGSPNYVVGQEDDMPSQELYDYTWDREAPSSSKGKESTPSSQPVLEELEKEMKELREAIVSVQLTVHSIKRIIQAPMASERSRITR